MADNGIPPSSGTNRTFGNMLNERPAKKKISGWEKVKK